MDEYDVIDFVYKAVESAETGIAIYKDKSMTGAEGEHIVINNLAVNEMDFTYKTPVNINIFIPLLSKGMINRQRMKDVKRSIRKSLDSINSNDGNCREINVLWSIPVRDGKEGFDCVNIRIDILTDKN